MQTALSDLDGAIKYITDAANSHPNRLDICNAKGGGSSQPQQPSTNLQAGIRGPSGSSSFGQPLFGKPAAPAFGQSSFGQASAPAFGKPSVGQAPAPAPAFGQPSGLAQKPTVFGQPSNLNPAPAFGQNRSPSPFGQTQQAAKPFGMQQPQQQPAFASQNNAFGQPSSTEPQASSIFGQQPAPGPSYPLAKAPTITSAFGQPAAAPANLFGQAAVPQASNAFSKTSTPQPASNPFGSKDSTQNLDTFDELKQRAAPAFGQPTAPASTGIFAKPAAQTVIDQLAPPAATGMFGRPAAQTTAGQAAAPASTGLLRKPPPRAMAVGSTAPSTQAKPGPPTHAKFGQDQRGNRILLSWQGQEVTYIYDDPCMKHPGDGGWQKIWFPEGPPTFTSKTQEYPEGYVLDDAARENFKYFVQHGVGSDGLIPDMPPPRDMISWNF